MQIRAGMREAKGDEGAQHITLVDFVVELGKTFYYDFFFFVQTNITISQHKLSSKTPLSFRILY